VDSVATIDVDLRTEPSAKSTLRVRVRSKSAWICAGMSVCPDGRLAVCDRKTRAVVLLDPATLEESGNIPLPGPIRSFRAAPGGKALFVISGTDLIRIDPVAGAVTLTIPLGFEAEHAAPVSEDLVVAGNSSTAAVVSLPRRAIVETVQCDFGVPLAVAPSERLVTHNVLFWIDPTADGVTRRFLRRPGREDGQPFPSRDSFASEDGRFLVTESGTLIRLGRGAGAHFVRLAALGPSHAGCFTPDGKWIVLFGESREVRLVNLATLKVRRKFTLDTSAAHAAAERKGLGVFVLEGSGSAGIAKYLASDKTESRVAKVVIEE
jgi:hypothetical protein